MGKKLKAILADAPNPWAALFAIRLLVSPVKVRREWHAVGYRFPWERYG